MFMPATNRADKKTGSKRSLLKQLRHLDNVPSDRSYSAYTCLYGDLHLWTALHLPPSHTYNYCVA